MKALRWAAVAATVLMSLLNLPIVLAAEEQDVPLPLAGLVSLVGLLGLAAAYGLVRRLPWGRPAVVGLGALNVLGAVVALADDRDGAALGLTLSLLMLVLGFLSDRRPAGAPALG